MGKLTTHVLDTSQGRPAAGVRIVLSRLEGETWQVLGEGVTNGDGRVDRPFLEGAALTTGVYELVFHIGAYFASGGTQEMLPFLDLVPLRFGIADASAHYHVPLLVTPWSFSTYRGS